MLLGVGNGEKCLTHLNLEALLAGGGFVKVSGEQGAVGKEAQAAGNGEGLGLWNHWPPPPESCRKTTAGGIFQN
jgi:hypothetical protein